MKIFHRRLDKMNHGGKIGYRVSGIGYRVSGIGYRVSGIGYRGTSLTSDRKHNAEIIRSVGDNAGGAFFVRHSRGAE